MLPVLVFLLATFRDSLRTRVGLQAEVLALRHQLLVLQRRNQKRRLQLSAFDRLLWVWLSRTWVDWKSALRIVKPETVIACHRKGFRLYWRWKSRPRHGRPPVTTEVRELIRRISAANPGWGAPRIHGELGKLGITVSETTVAKYMVRHRHPPSDLKELIRRISAANPGWGAPRIHGELGKLGITVSETTVAKYMVRHRHPP